MNIVIGCPVRERSWILPRWKEHVEASIPSGVDVLFAFVVGEDDMETIELLSTWQDTSIILVQELATGDIRSWKEERYHHMVDIRNELLSYVRRKRPDFFLSLDSDILIHPDLISNLLETVEATGADAVGGMTFFDQEDARCTNIAQWSDKWSGLTRLHDIQVCPVDIIMGIKLMTPEAYSINYKYSHMGEDLGWADSVRDLNIYADARVKNKHIMYREYLDREDPRCGY